MPKRSKKYQEAAKKIDVTRYYPVEDAIAAVKEASYAKIDETVEIAVRLGVNPKYPDQMVRGAVALPHGTGKAVRVLVFARGEKLQEARDAGADFVGAEDVIDKIKGGWLGFDKTVATPDVMGLVGRIGKILGPRGLMPNPKVGTVTFDVANAVREMKAGRIEFRVDRAGIVHAPLGKVSFPPDNIKDNMLALIDTIIRLKPASAKGTYLRGVSLAPTFGPGVKVDTNDLMRAVR